MSHPEREQNRLMGYDTSQNGAYFITVCVQDRAEILWKSVSRVIKQWKGAITKQAGTSIWQKSFHDHIIRNEREYEKIWNYIDGNPLCWEKDCLYPGNGKMPVTNIENGGK